MKKTIIALLIIAISGFALLQGSLWYFTQQFVDQQVYKAKPFAQISYKEIETSMQGSAIVKGVRVFIPAINETIFINSVEFKAPDVFTFLMLNSKTEQQQIPESLKLIILNAAINLNGPVMNMIDNPDIEPSAIEAFSTLACGDINRMGSRSLSKMGYEMINNNITLEYQFYPEKKRINYTVSNHIEDMSIITVSGELSNVSDIKSFSGKTLKPGKISLEIQDDSYIKRKNDFCALQEKYSVNEYITEHVRQVGEYLGVYGIEVEVDLLDAYKKLLKTMGSVRFDADLKPLSETISYAEELKTFAPNDIIQFIRLKLYVNDKRINQVSIKVDMDKLLDAASNNTSELGQPNSMMKKQVLVYKKYHQISLSNLNNYNGYRVRVETRNGRYYRGTLKTNNPKYYEVITHMRSGNIGYQVTKRNIKKIEAFY